MARGQKQKRPALPVSLDSEFVVPGEGFEPATGSLAATP